MAVANSADLYAAPRQNVFFSGVVPSLDGQCVSLVKWFLQDMTSVPNPQAARGDARYVGKTLVAQGHAVEVSYSDRKEGDIICYEYGTYGHIAVQLSGGRVFEQNVNLSGVSRRLITDGNESWYVYASRIASEGEVWRHDAHVYRIKSYKENDTMETFKDSNDVRVNGFNLFGIDIAGNDPALMAWVGKSKLDFFKGLGPQVVNNKEAQDKEIARLNDQIAHGKTCTADERAFLDATAKLYK